MSRPFWKGVISFGMVAIPVKMYVATENKTPALHLLHKKCLTRPRQVLYCEADNEYFSLKETVRAYEYPKDQYVVLEEADLEKVPISTAHTIEIRGFAEMSEIDPLYFSSTHYLEPDELGAKPFSLLRAALLKTGRAGIAKVTFQRREHLACLRPMDDILALHTLHYQDEVLPRNELAAPEQETTEEELKLATSLVETMERKFKPEEYEDKYSKALRKLVEAKIKGQEIAVPKVKKIEMPDLMAALRESVEAAMKKKSAAAKEPVSVRAARKE